MSEREPGATWTKVADHHPPPHSRYAVKRDGVIHTATPCYGMHQPWWVPTSLANGESEPDAMLDSDEWVMLDRILPPDATPLREGGNQDAMGIARAALELWFSSPIDWSGEDESLVRCVATAIQQARADEREACAQTCDDDADYWAAETRAAYERKKSLLSDDPDRPEVHRYHEHCAAMAAHSRMRAAAIRADNLPRASAWQPIETAPKDGTDILLGRESDKFVILAGWDEDPQQNSFYWVAPEGCRYRQNAFTHWAPVPPFRVRRESGIPVLLETPEDTR